MFIFKSSIGRKFVQAVSGAFGMRLVVVRGAGRFCSVGGGFTGR